MDREYPPGALESVQQIETDMLAEIDRICRENGLVYWVDGGTCLGAVRHRGFIPWDDDIDVGMPMEDFLRFEELAKTELPKDVSLHVMKSDSTQYVLWGKLYKESTTFMESDAVQAGCDECVFVDIFPYIRLDERHGDHGVGHLRRTQLWTKLIYIYRIKDPNVLKALSWRALAKVGWSAIRAVLHLVTNQDKLRMRFEKACVAKNPSEWWGNPSAARPYPFHHDTLMPPVELSFGDLTVFAPRDWNRFCSDLYADYMQLPPTDKRKSHSPLVLDLGDGVGYDWREGSPFVATAYEGA